MRELNGQIGRALIGVECVALFAYFLAQALHVNTIQQTILLTIISLFSIATIVFSLKKFADKVFFKYIMVTLSVILFISMAILVPINTGFIFGMCFTSIFILYNDYKIIRAAIAGYFISAMLGIVYWTLIVGTMPDGGKIDRVQFIVQGAATMLFSTILGISVFISQKRYEKQIAEIEEGKSKVQSIMNNVLDTANVVKESSSKGTEYVMTSIKQLKNQVKYLKELQMGIWPMQEV
jgi:hypothetical protein